jgi:3'(2'), 5'-bisphosphate nucleotidase
VELLMRDRDTLLQATRAIAESAAAVALRFYGAADLDVQTKSDASPVTAADRATSDFICGHLARLTPGVPVVSEENASSHGAAVDAPFWLVDPLDGTKEFLRGTGEFTINIALIEAGSPVLGVVHVPAKSLAYFAATGIGATRAAGGEAGVSVHVRAAQPGRIAVVASRDHAGPRVAAMLERLPGAATVSMGSSLKFCLVAEGSADVYLRDVPTMEWDTAAAHCVVAAAGGHVMTLDGEPLKYGKPGLRNPGILTIGDSSYPWSHYL